MLTKCVWKSLDFVVFQTKIFFINFTVHKEQKWVFPCISIHFLFFISNNHEKCLENLYEKNYWTMDFNIRRDMIKIYFQSGVFHCFPLLYTRSQVNHVAESNDNNHVDLLKKTLSVLWRYKKMSLIQNSYNSIQNPLFISLFIY